ncbi:hypothetical protein EST38_g9209 [Candolleomyces aberdarensis]|uniref:Uncharacterized protein n=1 Tax=Candolleomyces aberdarensis TaxID=2316362 RepID=A0A4Q2DDF1_9AGAR|nr:hypothetical protein EST38_g9209 [Candolleomyces aberdarensis]
MSITLRFTGSAIYTFFILVNNAGQVGVTSRTDCKFVLDNGPAVSYLHMPDQSKANILYNQLVFHQTGLANTEHALEIVTEGLDYQTYVNFDYAIYTHHDDAPPSVNTTTDGSPSSTPGSEGSTTYNSSSKTPIWAIAGGVAGAILFAVVASFLFFCLRHQQKQTKLGKRPATPLEELNYSDMQYRVDPFIQVSPHHRGPPSSALGRTSQPLYRSVLQRMQHGLRGNYPALPPIPASSGYSDSSSYAGIATRGYPSDSDQVSSATGGTLSNAWANSEFSTSTFPKEKGNRIANPPLPPLPAGSSHLVFSVTNPDGQGGRQIRQAEIAERSSTVEQEMNPDEQERVRQIRQAEIAERLRTVEQEMDKLKRGFSTMSRQTSQQTNATQNDVDVDERGDTVGQTREQMRVMQQEIQMLRESQRSDWAMGLTDEPPPGYTANPTPRPVSGQH